MTAATQNQAGPSPLLEVKDLQISFFRDRREIPAIRGISYTLQRGEVLGIVGESGSGKSVSSRAIMRLAAPNERVTGGEILFDGRDVLKLTGAETAKLRGSDISMIFQDPMTSLDPLFPIGYQIEEVLKKHTQMDKAARRARMLELLTLVGINQPERRLSQYPHEFSGGMRQRVMIAMALACSPKLLIADEPTTALDVTIQAQIIDLLKSLKDRLNMAIIFITHDMGVVADICDRIAVMYAGEIVEMGSKREIFYSHRHPYTEGLLASVPKVDGTKKVPLQPIEGNPPDMTRVGKECAFARRCPYAMQVCAGQISPPVVGYEEDHYARCWRCYRQCLDEKGGT